MKFTACPMDCYDACKVEYINGKCKPSKNEITNGKLCKLFAFLNSQAPLIDKDLNKTLEKFVDKLKEPNKKVLYYKGAGNLGVMQSIPKKFFEKYGATFAQGGLCTGAGDAGLEFGRGINVNPTIEELKSSELILVWGRNLSRTSRHIYKLIEDKKFITIDPVETEIAKLSDIYLQIPPKGDFLLAKLFSDALDKKEVSQSDLDKLNILRSDFNKIIELLSTKKVSVMIGLGVQKYKEGAEIIHEIDKFCEKLGLLDGKNIGVWYLGTSAYGFNSKISTSPTKTCNYSELKFDDYDIVFIQGANPVISALNTNKIVSELKNTFVVYMGICEDDTSKYADIIIPAKTFLQKKDVRLSYGHDEVHFCEICEENPYAISEYELTSYLFDTFGFDGLLSEDEYLDVFKEKRKDKPSFIFEKKEFDVEMLELDENEFYLITSKSTNTLNSQFKYDEFAYVHPSLGYSNGDIVKISSEISTIEIKVKNDEKVFKKAILFYAGNKIVNSLIPDVWSNFGENASFQDVKLKIDN